MLFQKGKPAVCGMEKVIDSFTWIEKLLTSKEAFKWSTIIRNILLQYPDT